MKAEPDALRAETGHEAAETGLIHDRLVRLPAQGAEFSHRLVDVVDLKIDRDAGVGIIAMNPCSQSAGFKHAALIHR